jgi:hypothetical protein
MKKNEKVMTVVNFILKIKELKQLFQFVFVFT